MISLKNRLPSDAPVATTQQPTRIGHAARLCSSSRPVVSSSAIERPYQRHAGAYTRGGGSRSGGPAVRPRHLTADLRRQEVNPKVAPVGVDSQVNSPVANAFILQMRTDPAAAKQAAGSDEAASAARRRLMDGLQGAAREGGFEDRVSGDAKLRDAKGRANAPTVPSAVRAYPALQPPFLRPDRRR